MSIPIQLAETDSDLVRCFPVLVQLRPQLPEREFISRVRGMMTEGYRLAFLCDDSQTIRAVAGFRLFSMLYSGRTLYVDDLVTDAASRSQGYGDKLIDWLAAFARAEGCEVLSLDSGTQRADAHRFYLRKRMRISCFHFELPLKVPH